MHPIVTLTVNPTIDTSTIVPHVIADRKLRCQAPQHEPGGGGINVSRAIHKLGGTALTVYPVGGPTGQRLQQLLEAEGLSLQPVPIRDWTRENFMVLEEVTGRQFRFVMPGPTLQTAEWQHCLDLIATMQPTPAYIVASGSLAPGIPTDFYARVARLGHTLGARVIVDTPGEALQEAVRAGVYLVKPNLPELNDLAGRELQDEAEQEVAAIELVHLGHTEAVVLSLSAAGVLLVTAAGCERLRAPTVPIISRVGAGDSMVAGLVLGLSRALSLRQAVLFGIAAGTAAVMTPGTALCRREDAERLYARMQEEYAPVSL
jgi:6-phosphofructokinase 2